MKKVLKITSRNPVQYAAKIEALSNWLLFPTKSFGVELLEMISDADEDFCTLINYGLQQTDSEDCFQCPIENFVLEELDALAISVAMVSAKTFAVYFQYNAHNSDIEVEFVSTDPETAKIEFRKRVDKVKGFFAAMNCKDSVRITA